MCFADLEWHIILFEWAILLMQILMFIVKFYKYL